MLDRPDSDTRSRLADIVRRIVSAHADARPERIEENLREAGLTSLDMVRLALSIETEFGIMLGADDMHPDNFQTLDRLDMVVRRQLSA
jgi:acyl carrier protein